MLLDSCLRRISALDRDLRAWATVDPRPPTSDGPLRGIPFGAKDIYETAGMATEYGSPLYAGRVGERDAAVVAILRGLGALLIGKTRTAAFASFDPPETRNPNAPGHTPGGSSSGSAAAVAAGMVPFALGTQTLGSVLRPASYCGVCGFKPTFGRLSTDGVLPFAPTLDTVGFFTEDAADMEALWALAFHAAPAPRPLLAQPDLQQELELVDNIGRAGWLKALRQAATTGQPLAKAAPAPRHDWPPALYFDTAASPEMRHQTMRSIERLQRAGMHVDVTSPPPGYDELLFAAFIINKYEGARTHQDRWRRFGTRIGTKLAELVELGLALPDSSYRLALETVQQERERFAELFRRYPLIFSPAAFGAAPHGLESTGDPAANAPWTALGVPAISIPMRLAPGEPPLGLQMVAGWNRDEFLLSAAVRCAETL
jgi:Asp-tRNA(Asn)/Glu-tRNA(Gln) amidotransferase A subunit family amidase